MEDINPSSDDEVQEGTLSPQQGGKKLKLNDGSSQDNNLEASSSKGGNEENMDSGVSADKSGSPSSDDRAGGDQGPSNEVVNVAPSTSNVRALLLNIRRPRLGRNYRKRKTPDGDSDSNSSRDSDDLSETEEVTSPTSRQTDNSEDELPFMRVMSNLSDESIASELHMGDTDNSNSGSSYYTESDDMVRIHSGSGSESEEPWSREGEEEETDKSKLPKVLLKTKPKHNYLLLREIINREMGLTFPGYKTTQKDVSFERNFYGSLNAVHRLKRLHHLNKHRGCVNAINFHPEGHLLASGSDDLNVIIWDWARNKMLQTIKTGHKSNVFQSKFMYLNARSQLNIVTCARDGQVRLLQCPPSGGQACRRRLGAHSRAAHKLHVSPAQPHQVLSAGEDAAVLACDVRQATADKLFTVKEKSSLIPLYSIHGHPLDPNYLLVAGRDRYVRVYDRRKCSKPVAKYCPNMFNDNVNASKKNLRISMMHLTCAVYSHDGGEILASYNDQDIYLFDAKADVYDKDSHKDGYTYRFSGHRNSATFKGVSFFGPRSQYVVSGSDCSYIYIWDKKTEAIVQWMQGDVGGVVNCIEAHPHIPVLATSGLDKDVKIWIPRSQDDVKLSGLSRVVRENTMSQLRSPLFNDFLPTLYSAWRGESRLMSDLADDNNGGLEFSSTPNIEFDGGREYRSQSAY